MSGKLPVSGFGLAYLDARQIGNLSTPVLASRVWPALDPRHAQAGHKIALELVSVLGLDDLVDTLVQGT